MDLGRVGVWSSQLRYGDPGSVATAAAELEALGYGAIWVPGGAGGDVLGDCGRLLDATERVVLAPGILNIWMHDPGEVADGHHRLTAAHPGRFLLGLGVSHALLIDRTGTYARPLAKMREYLDALDGAHTPVPTGERILAALGPKMLELARDRSAGTHPYLVTPEHTATAREAVGPGKLVAPEQKVVLDTDAGRARAIAREALGIYLRLPNYTNNLLRTGFSEDDLAGGGSDRLIDGIVAWGDEAAIAARVRAHHDAGADHVCIQVLLADRAAMPLDEWRRLGLALC
ncbi:MAG TPA: LLM class F420-dependent oxidoreductase [Acidimicrobiales bacterium]